MTHAMLRPTADCECFAASIDPYVDGELDACHAMDMDAHALACPACAERVATCRAIRRSLRRVAETQRAPDALRARLCAAMLVEKRRVEGVGGAELASASEAERGIDGDGSREASPKLVALKYAVAFAAAAGIAFAVGLPRLRKPLEARSNPWAYASAAASPLELDAMLEDLVALHAHPLPPETTNPDELQRFDPLVGVPVRRPSFKLFGASFDGARVHAVRDRRTAILQYSTPSGHRITVYVFDPLVMPVIRATLLQPRMVRERHVFVGTLRGYSVAAAESKKRGVGYALASDLGDDESSDMVVAAVQ